MLDKIMTHYGDLTTNFGLLSVAAFLSWDDIEPMLVTYLPESQHHWIAVGWFVLFVAAKLTPQGVETEVEA